MVNCIYCGADSKLTKIHQTSDGLNGFGRREIGFEVESDDPVYWENKLFHCKKCSMVFTFQEYTNQKPKVEDKLKEYFK